LLTLTKRERRGSGQDRNGAMRLLMKEILLQTLTNPRLKVRMKTIKTPKAPPPAGHYSQAIVHDGIVYAAGQLGIDPAQPAAPPGTIEAQTEQTLANVGAVLEAAGSGLD